MTAVAFDTLKYAEALKTAGVPEAQAEALAEALRQGGQELATKADLAELRMATRADLAELKTELKADIAKLQTDIAWIKWIITGGGRSLCPAFDRGVAEVTRGPRWGGDTRIGNSVASASR